MGKKKMKLLPFLYHHHHHHPQSKSSDPKLCSSSSSSSSSSSPWPFPSCGYIKTLSFRAKDDENDDDNTFRTFNSAFLEAELTPPESFFTVSSSSRSFSTMSEDSGDPLESVIRGLRSDRLFFEPERSSSLLLRPAEEAHAEKPSQQKGELDSVNVEEMETTTTTTKGVAYRESEVLSMESNSPYDDFRNSMEEMVEAHGLKDWQGLEELLGCYLKINGKNNHGYIVGAFIDLLVSLSFTSFDDDDDDDDDDDENTTTSRTTTTSATTTTNSTTTTTTTTTTTSTTSSNYSNYSSPSSPLSLPSSSLTTPCLSSIVDQGDDEHDDDDDDDGDHVTC